MDYWNGIVEWPRPRNAARSASWVVKSMIIGPLAIMEHYQRLSRSVTQVGLQRGTRDKATLKHILRSVPGKKRGWRQPRFSTALIASAYPGWPSTLLTWFLV